MIYKFVSVIRRGLCQTLKETAAWCKPRTKPVENMKYLWSQTNLSKTKIAASEVFLIYS